MDETSIEPISAIHQTVSIPYNLNLEKWDWMQDQRNQEVVTCGDKVLFHPEYAYGTAAVRGNKMLTAGTIAYWEIDIEHLYGTSVMFGIGNKYACDSQSMRFLDLLGFDANSYGLNHMGKAQHCGIITSACRQLQPKYCTIGILFNGPERTMSYFENGQFLCKPFIDVNVTNPLYPMISSTAQQSEFVVKNQRCLTAVQSLKQVLLFKVASIYGENSTKLHLPIPLLKELCGICCTSRHYLPSSIQQFEKKKKTEYLHNKMIDRLNTIEFVSCRCGMGVEDDR